MSSQVTVGVAVWSSAFMCAEAVTVFMWRVKTRGRRHVLRMLTAAAAVQDEQWDNRFERFPEHTPVNKEYYLLRSIFEERFPSEAALNTVPKGLSIACSTPEAVAWDPEWANVHDISGRAVSFHEAAAGYDSASEMAEPARAAVTAGAVRPRVPQVSVRKPRFPHARVPQVGRVRGLRR